MKVINQSILNNFFFERPAKARKYDYGHLLIVAGAVNYTGAPVLACMAALRSGVDVVTLAAPERAANIAAGFSPCIITSPLEGDFLMEKHLKKLLDLAEGKDAVAIGPGIGRKEETLEMVREFVYKINVPVVVDADGIYAFEGARIKNSSYMTLASDNAKRREKTKGKNKKPNLTQPKVIFTPHIRELEVLHGKHISDDSLEKRAEIAKEAAQRTNAIILLKGPIDLITDGKEVHINKTGSPYMSSAGTGDVLCGIAGSLLAQLNTSGRGTLLQAASTAAYLSGMAGENASQEFKHGLIATDVIAELPFVIG